MFECSFWFRTVNGPMSSPIQLLTISVRHTCTLSLGKCVELCIFDDLYMIARFNTDFYCASSRALLAVRAACARSANEALYMFGLRNSCREENSSNMSAEGSHPSGSSVFAVCFDG